VLTLLLRAVCEGATGRHGMMGWSEGQSFGLTASALFGVLDLGRDQLRQIRLNL